MTTRGFVGCLGVVATILLIGSCSNTVTLPGPAAGVALFEGTREIQAGDTYTFPATKVGTASPEVTFTIKNTGDTELAMVPSEVLAITGTEASQFTLSTAPTVTTLSAGNSTTFGLTFSPSAHATASAIGVLKTVYNETPYAVCVVLAGAGKVGQIEVVDLGETPYTGNTVVPSGTGVVNFGTARLFGTPNAITRRLQINNTGDAELVLSSTSPISITGDTNTNFSVDSTQTTTPIPPGSSTIFDLTFSAVTGSGSTVTAQMTINSDSDTDKAFAFDISGTDLYS